MAFPATEPAKAPSALTAVVRVVVFLFLAIAVQAATYVVLQAFGLFVGATLSTFAGGAVATAIALRIYQRGQLSSIGLSGHPAWAKHMGIGFLLGAGGAVFTVGLPIVIGKAFFVAAPDYPLSLSGLFLLCICLLFGAMGEELIFRGYPFQFLAGRFGTFQILLPLAVLFAAMHADNLNVSRLGLFNTFAWGVLLGYSVLRSGDLWLPIGIHYGWNFTLPLFGVNLSGFTMGLTGYTLEWRASDLWSGGSYGPEASVLTLITVIGLFFVLHRVPLTRQRLPLMPEEDPTE